MLLCYLYVSNSMIQLTMYFNFNFNFYTKLTSRSILRQRYVDEWNSQGGSSMLSMYQVFMKELKEEPDLTVVPICDITNKK